jgi:hypothetical protein
MYRLARICCYVKLYNRNVLPCDNLTLDMDTIRLNPFSIFWICDDTVSISDATVTKVLHGKFVSSKI